MQFKRFSRLVPKTQVHSVQQVLTSHQLTAECYHFSSPKSTAIPTTSTSNTETSRTIAECPRATPFEVLRGYLPGGKYYKKDSNEFLRIITREKGNAVVMRGIFGKPDLFLTQNPDDFEIIFRNEGVWPERRGMELMCYHRNVLRKDYFGEFSGLVTTQGKVWSDFRNMVNPILMHPKNAKIYLPALSRVNQEFIERIKEIRDPETLEVPENFKDEIGNWTLESVSCVALDHHLGTISGKNTDGLRISKNFLKFFEISMELEGKPSLWRYLPNRRFKEVMGCLDDIILITEKFVNEAMERIEKRTTEAPENEQSVLEKLLKLDKKIAKIMAMDMLLAGVDTTTTSFTGLLLCLAKNPEKQEKLRQEILQILAHKDSPLTVENMKNMPYLRACFKESIRIYPLTVGNIRTLSKDLQLSGYHVPKGTDVLMLFLNLQEDERHFSSPREFIPERWLRQAKEVTATESTSNDKCPHATKSNNPFVYMPFGLGVRSCIGRRIAEMEMEIGIVRIIRNFQVEFNYSTENAFKSVQINVPDIPLKFKFTDLPY